MELKLLDHVELRSAEPEALADWYTRILGLERGYRPSFELDGIWLYLGELSVVHILAQKEQPETRDPRIDHFAFRAKGLASLIERLEAARIHYRVSRMPETRAFQVFISDPESNHMHIDFSAEEADELGF